MVSPRDHVLRRLIVAVALLSFALPAAAQAAGTATTTVPASALSGSTSPFSVGVPQSQGTTTTATTPTVASTTSTATNGSFDGLDIVLIVAGVGVVIVGTWLFVIRDARKTGRQLRHGKPAVSAAGANAGSKPATRSRKLSAQEKKRRKRGRAPRRR